MSCKKLGDATHAESKDNPGTEEKKSKNPLSKLQNESREAALQSTPEYGDLPCVLSRNAQ